jgi:hypothetical protein
MGGDDETGQGSGNNLPLEMYKPSYFFEERPVIMSSGIIMSTDMNYSELGGDYTFNIESDPDTISEVALIRPGSVTHGYNMDQRYIELKILERGVNFLRVLPPPDENVAPAGYYMIVIMTPPTCLPGDHNHAHCGPIPSIGKWVRLTT